MSDKKILIIEKASELFAKNGFDATSIQEITDACGISKGSFYLSFKSKESLLFSIFEYFSTKLIDRIGSIHQMDIGPRERFEQFFVIQFEEIARYSDFILMQMREQTNPINEEMMGIMNDMRRKTYEAQESLLLELYGEDIIEHMTDLIVILGGITKGYIEIIVFNKNSLNYVALAHYIVERIDSIVNGLSTPFLTRQLLVGHGMCGGDFTIKVEELLKDIKLLTKGIADEDLIISLEIIEQELSAPNYRKPVLSGMMSNLKKSELTEEFARKIKLFLDQSV
ncbi:TetR/AcrR family transcriptional regulator [Sporosarcina sp. JAI121]|uniref:TetR/AcrR family transcriptional regulator n=1 Tax=Sporosarcina sp. JAI121 TaxID=2723064 RepID=UPI0015C98F4C|nr:TetR/AcrR family transcriptional regulator [Sporosarcina sp. JAI121]NYF25258.1 AcrR family transcriptional regulator [Sporosarcina sp. JAI121]